jgi:hypothetical protein
MHIFILGYNINLKQTVLIKNKRIYNTNEKNERGGTKQQASFETSISFVDDGFRSSAWHVIVVLLSWQ